jgi:hypothetical protein
VVESATPRAYAVSGSDGGTHIEYDLVVTNAFTADVTLTGLVVQDDAGRELRRLEGDDLRATTFKLFSSDPTLTVPPSAAVAVIVDVSLPKGKGNGLRAVQNQLTYALRDDAPARTIIGGTTVPGPRIEVDPKPAVVVSSPLSGDGWLSFNGCCLGSTAHRSALLPSNGVYRAIEMFAVDWVRVRGDQVFDGDGTTLTEHYAYGAEVRAATAGEVVSVRSEMDEASVNGSSTGNPTVKEPRDYAGNHVVVRSGSDRFAVYGHLQTGSLRVRVGDRVKVGDVLGLLGNSGNSTAPHLHFSIQNGPDALTSDSLPFVIDDYQVTGIATFLPTGLRIDAVDSPQRKTHPLVTTIATFEP